MWSWVVGFALARPVGPLPTDEDWAAHVSLVDQLGWAASDQQVKAYLKALRSDRQGPLARSLAEGFRGRMGERGVPLYAVEAELIDALPGPSRRLVHVRQAVIYTNRAKVPLTRLTFRLAGAGYHVHPRSARVLDARVETRPIPHELRGTLLTLELPEPLKPGQHTRVMLELLQDLPPIDATADLADPDALPAEAVGGQGFTEDRVHLGSFVAVATRLRDDGSFDERELPPSGEASSLDPAHFHVVLDLPADQTVAASGVRAAHADDEERSTHVFAAAAHRDFSAASGRDLDVREVDVDGLKVRILHPASEALMGRHLSRWVKRALPVLIDTYGPLSMAEVDLVEAPLHVAMGLEFHGMALVDLHHKSGSYLRDKVHAVTVSHELAHQWWSAEVGSDARDAPWIDEALASHGADLVLEAESGPQAVRARHHEEVVLPTLRLQEEGLADLPADLPSEAYDLWRYSVIVYGRAPMFVDRVRQHLGPDAFREAMRGLVARHRGGHITADDLLRAWRAHTDDPDTIDALHRAWIREAHAYEGLLETP